VEVMSEPFDWRVWVLFMFTDNSKETQALSDDALRVRVAEEWDALQSLANHAVAHTPDDGLDVLERLRSIKGNSDAWPHLLDSQKWAIEKAIAKAEAK
jgi:hypothetical protein